jgi:hypothetical protein
MVGAYVRAGRTCLPAISHRLESRDMPPSNNSALTALFYNAQRPSNDRQVARFTTAFMTIAQKKDLKTGAEPVLGRRAHKCISDEESHCTTTTTTPLPTPPQRPDPTSADRLQQTPRPCDRKPLAPVAVRPSEGIIILRADLHRHRLVIGLFRASSHRCNYVFRGDRRPLKARNGRIGRPRKVRVGRWPGERMRDAQKNARGRVSASQVALACKWSRAYSDIKERIGATGDCAVTRAPSSCCQFSR